MKRADLIKHITGGVDTTDPNKALTNLDAEAAISLAVENNPTAVYKMLQQLTKGSFSQYDNGYERNDLAKEEMARKLLSIAKQSGNEKLFAAALLARIPLNTDTEMTSWGKVDDPHPNAGIWDSRSELAGKTKGSSLPPSTNQPPIVVIGNN